MKKQSEITFRYNNENCEIILGHYQYTKLKKKPIAMKIQVANGELKGSHMTTASTNLEEYNYKENEITIKVNDEGKELFNILVEENIVIYTGYVIEQGYNTYAVCRLNIEVDMPFVS